MAGPRGRPDTGNPCRMTLLLKHLYNQEMTSFEK